MNFIGATLKGYGCAGLSSVSYGLIIREVERVDSAYRSALSVQSSLVMYPIYAFGSDYLKDKYLPKLATGELIGCFGLTEPNAGSDPASMETKARKDGNSYILNGSKMWITNGPDADVVVVYAKTEPEKHSKGISTFIIEKDFKGFKVAQKLDKLGMRGSSTGELVFEDCEVN